MLKFCAALAAVVGLAALMVVVARRQGKQGKHAQVIDLDEYRRRRNHG
jgi:hypothetical protein